MGKDHLKRIAVPKTWPIERKASVFVMRTQSGKLQDLSLPLGFVLKEVLGICETSRQAVAMLSEKRVSVDGKIRKGRRYPVGLFDVIELIDAKKAYRLGLGPKGKMVAVEIDLAEKDTRIVRISGKSYVKGGKTQFSFLNGRVALLESAKSYKVGDSILLDASQKVTKHLPFAKGAYVQFIGGKHIGNFGSIKEIDGQKIVVESEGNTFETVKRYAFVVGEKKQEVKVA